MKEYRWKQISRWDIPLPEFYIQHKKIKTGLSEETCTYMLVKNIDVIDGYIRSQPINKNDVTSEMLEITGVL